MRLRGPILTPRTDGSVHFIPDGLLIGDDRGRISYSGPWDGLSAEPSGGVVCPPFLDAHIHISQHPIRGKFMEGVVGDPPEGRLIASLNRNIFPAEAKCADPAYARQVVQDFLSDTLSNGVIGGAAYMTVHPAATRIALEILPATWSVGLVLMDMNCPEYLRTDVSTIEHDIESLAGDFGRRLIVTDRFAVTVSSPLRQKAVQLAHKFSLRMQTHLNEQQAEKRLIEKTLYPQAGSYTDVYDRDGLLDCQPILAHCIHMTPHELELLSRKRAAIAHCPTSNQLLGSGTMPLDGVLLHDIDFAICTDVAASPTTSLLYEIRSFLSVHQGRSRNATPSQAFYRTTLAPSRILELDKTIGSLESGKAMTFNVIECDLSDIANLSVDELIQTRLLDGKVRRVVVEGRTVWC